MLNTKTQIKRGTITLRSFKRVREHLEGKEEFTPKTTIQAELNLDYYTVIEALKELDRLAVLEQDKIGRVKLKR